MKTFYVFLLVFFVVGCTSEKPPIRPWPLTRLSVDRNYLRDAYGRYIFFHGVNVSGSTKVPVAVGGNPITPENMGETHVQGKPTYVGLPFPGHIGRTVSLEEVKKAADEGFKKLRDAGFSAVRLLINWEGIEPTRKGDYDRDYLASIRTLVETANRYGIYVLLDMHQDAFSRHLVVRYNEFPSYEDPVSGTVQPPPGTIENTLLALVPPYTDTVRGEGAPRWAVEACLQEKVIDSPHWGTPRVLRLLNQLTLSDLMTLGEMLGGFLGQGSEGTQSVPAWAVALYSRKPEPFEPYETTDALPFTNWGIMATLSIDVVRCFFCMFASEAAFPGLTIKDEQGRERSVRDYLQEAYANAWKEVVKQVKDLPNVIGYDIMNEPITNAIVLSAVGAVIATGVLDSAKKTLVDLLGKDKGELVYKLITGLGILPPLPQKPAPPDPPCRERQGVAKEDCEKAYKAELAQYEAERAKVLRDYGLDKMDPFAVLGFNYGFDRAYLKPFYERIGKAILEVDPDAVIFVEPSLNASLLFGNILGGFWDLSMDPLDLPRVVYAPHWYADIYPFLGINQPDREFKVEEVRYRDYQPMLEQTAALAGHSLGNVPVVFGEFGTYFKFGGIEKSHAEGYIVSAHILDNYFEALERMFVSRFLWCFTPDNDKRYGDLWNKEDFSILGFDGQFRAKEAWARPFPKALAGRPISLHYYSPLHYFDLNSKTVPPYGEFEVVYDAKETDVPTEIIIPDGVYPNGFYVWLSDGFAYFDPESRTLYHFPDKDEPDAQHFVRIRPPLPGQENVGWRYFFKGDKVIRAY